MTPVVGEGVALLGGGAIGAALMKLASVWLEGRSKSPSKVKDASDLIAATAAFQAALNTAASGIVGDLRETVERLEAEIENLKMENEKCRQEGEALLQRDRERQQQFSSLTRLLKARGIDLTAEGLEGSLIVLEGDRADVVIPGPMEAT